MICSNRFHILFRNHLRGRGRLRAEVRAVLRVAKAELHSLARRNERFKPAEPHPAFPIQLHLFHLRADHPQQQEDARDGQWEGADVPGNCGGILCADDGAKLLGL